MPKPVVPPTPAPFPSQQPSTTITTAFLPPSHKLQTTHMLGRPTFGGATVYTKRGPTDEARRLPEGGWCCPRAAGGARGEWALQGAAAAEEKGQTHKPGSQSLYLFYVVVEVEVVGSAPAPSTVAGSPVGPSLAARDSNPLLGGELVVIQVRCRTPINKMGALGALPLLPPPAARLKLPVCPASRPYYIPGDWALRCCSPNHHHARGPDRIYAVLTCGTSRIRRDLQAQVQISSTKRPFLASGPRQCDHVVQGSNSPISPITTDRTTSRVVTSQNLQLVNDRTPHRGSHKLRW